MINTTKASAWLDRKKPIRLWEMIPKKSEETIRIMTNGVSFDLDYKCERSSDRLVA